MEHTVLAVRRLKAELRSHTEENEVLALLDQGCAPHEGQI